MRAILEDRVRVVMAPNLGGLMIDYTIAAAIWFYEHWSSLMLTFIAYCSWCCTVSLAHIYARLLGKSQ